MAVGAGGRSARGGASSRRDPREEARSGEGEEAESEGWSGGSDNTLDAETEEEGWGHATLTVSPWGTQERGARGLRVDARVGRSDGQKAPSATTIKAGTRGHHGAWEQREVRKDEDFSD